MTDIWIPLAPGITTLPPSPTPTVNASPSPINAATLPGDWDPDDPDLLYLFDTILATSSPAVYPLVMTPGSVFPPYNETVFALAKTRTTLSVLPRPYALTLLPTAASLTTKTKLQLMPPTALVTKTKLTASLGSVYQRVSGTAAPLLGNTQASISAAESDGWTLTYNSTADEISYQLQLLGFSVATPGATIDRIYITSNQYITFESKASVYAGLSSSVPDVPKIHLGSDDFSFQRVYQKIESNVYRVRWEGNSSYSAPAGDSNRFLEVALFKPRLNGTTFIEVRSGDIDGSTSGPFMLADATTALASGTFAANESWVYEGTGDGTTWTLYTGEHME